MEEDKRLLARGQSASVEVSTEAEDFTVAAVVTVAVVTGNPVRLKQKTYETENEIMRTTNLTRSNSQTEACRDGCDGYPYPC